MRQLTGDELITARTHLDIIKAIQQEATTRQKYAHSSEFQVELTEAGRIAHLIITGAMLDTLEQEVTHLSEKLGVDVLGSAEEQLAQVIELFDGNRRLHRR